MPVIAFANMKGGVGKTTLCVNLAFDLFRHANRVLVVDNDPQCNATSALLKPKWYIDEILNSDTAQTIYNIYEKPPRIRGARPPNPIRFPAGGDRIRSGLHHRKIRHLHQESRPASVPQGSCAFREFRPPGSH